MRPSRALRPQLTLVRRPSLADADDAALARAAAADDPGAPAAVWDRFSPIVRGVLRRSLGPEADVDDHVQEVFLRFFKEVTGLRDPSALRSFIVGITIRVARGELRRRRIRRWLFLTSDGSVPERHGAEPDADAREAIARLYTVLDRMDDQSRLVFVLRHIEGLELTDIADALGTSLSTIKRKLDKVVARVVAIAGRDPILAGYLTTDPAAVPIASGG